MPHRTDPDIDALTLKYGEPLGAVEWNEWTFHSNMWIFTSKGSKDIKCIGSGREYPVIGVTLKDTIQRAFRNIGILSVT